MNIIDLVMHVVGTATFIHTSEKHFYAVYQSIMSVLAKEA